MRRGRGEDEGREKRRRGGNRRKEKKKRIGRAEEKKDTRQRWGEKGHKAELRREKLE